MINNFEMPTTCSIRRSDLIQLWIGRMEHYLAGHNICLAKQRKDWCNGRMQNASRTDRDILALSDTQDAIDIRESLAGDGEAYDRLVKRYQTPIANTMWRFTQDRRQLEELVQDVFVEGYMSLRTYSATAPFLHWLQRIATRVGYRYWKRRQKLRSETTWTEQHEQLAYRDTSTLSAHEAADFVQHILAELAPRDRLVLTLSYLEQRNTDEIADLTGWSKSLVKVQLHRARKRLAKICEQKGIEL